MITDILKQEILQSNINNDKIQTQNEITGMKSYVESKITILLDVLSNESIVESNRLTLKGNICSFFNEINPIIMGSIVNESLTTDIIRNISIDEFLGFLTCFYPIKVNENNKTYSIINCRNNSRNLQYLVDRAIEIQQIYVKYETNNRFVTGEFSDEITFDLIDYVIDWAKSDNESDCKNDLKQYFNNLFEPQ